ncbi:MAG: class I SAM-dependent methyltransferase [Candidatus Methanomethyliaceae archaeon]|nr:class I SAM-dependent methyltransferase [Candidatus Verstraetearchaeota archaeon]
MPETNSGNKIYGYDENLWYEMLKSQYWTGDRDIDLIEVLLRKKGRIKRILDLGCGVGRISNRLAVCGFEVTGIDLSKKCIEEAKRDAKKLGVSKNTNYFVGDYKEFCLDPTTPSEFDAAICILAPAWKTVDDMRVFFSSLCKKIRKKGILILVDILKEKFLNSLLSSPSIQNWFRFSEDILSLHTWNYDPVNSRVRTEKVFYRRSGENLRYVVRIKQEYALYSINDYFEALSKSWRIEGIFTFPINMLRLDNFNDPWWLFSTIIVAESNPP